MDFLKGSNIYVYLFIFVGKILEVSTATLRNVLINRGERNKGSLISFVEIVLWILVTGTVLIGFTEDFIKVIVFCFAFTIGTFLGSWLENKLALGLSTLQVIASDNEMAYKIVGELRDNNIAVTVMNAEGKVGAKKLLLIHIKRNRVVKTINLISEIDSGCVVTVSDVKVLKGGFIKK